MRAGWWGGLLLTGVVVLAGCGGASPEAGPETTPEPSPGVSTPGADTPAPPVSSPDLPALDCAELLTQAAVRDLANERLGPPRAEAVSGLPGCRWESASSGAWVLAVAVRASAWAEAVPAVVEAALGSGEEFEGKEQLEEVRRLIAEGEATDDAASCRIFSTLLSALQGLPAGTQRYFDYIPSRQAPEGVSQQACLGGRYYSLQVFSPTLKPGPALEKRVRQALDDLN